tara:strand:+ start:2725 stop:4227 length:1503 start_codon:yes stop_codon:yes gene_type:complete
MKKILLIILLIVNSIHSQSTPFYKGGDISILDQIEDNGGTYTENGVVINVLDIFKNHDINLIRLKLWHTPDTDYNSLPNVLEMASRIIEADMKFLLDIHYSDSWADPGHQTTPTAWENLSFEILSDSVYQYTKSVLESFKEQNLLPHIVQIGNEIDNGFLWPYGSVSHWGQFTDLLNAGILGVNDALADGDTVKIMIHIAKGGDNNGSVWFFDNLENYNVDFDLIGQSFYPWWHGTFDNLEYNLNDLAERYDKEIIVVETAYPWTLNWNDNTHNIVGSEQLLDEYPASVNGQKQFLGDLLNIVENIPNDLGKGFCYWSPEWISTETFGSPWENLSLFDFEGEVLETIQIFETVDTTITLHHQNGWNLVGLPLMVTQNESEFIFPDAVEGTLFSFDGVYMEETHFQNGNGYWLRFNDAGGTTIGGTSINELTISLNEGWNLISGISIPLNITAIQDPDGIIISGTVYEFTSGVYSNTEILEPGKGYWIRANSSGSIILIDN